ncbi:GMC oxidoreductase family protein [Abortiporus biennis]
MAIFSSLVKRSLLPLFFVSNALLAGAVYFTDPSQLTKTEYDFVIVGAGTAGSVLANRLSQDANVTVLVIEAGASDVGNVVMEIPFLSPTLVGTSVDWNFTTVPQTGLDDRVLFYPRGKVLGGSSSTNLLIWNKGSNQVYDNWAKLTGDSEWSWNSLSNFYQKSTSFVRPTPSNNRLGHVNSLARSGGPVHVSINGVETGIDDYIFNTSVSLGGRFFFNIDYNAGISLGTGFIQSSNGGGQRNSAATAYLHPAELRPNLDILINTQVTRLLTQSDANSTTPIFRTVEFAQDASGPRSVVNATKEVILAAGAIGTPQILLLSGIGPQEELSALNISTVVNNSDVGLLVDHPMLVNYFSVDFNGTWDDAVRDPNQANALVLEWMTARDGLFVDSAGTFQSFQRLPTTPSDDPASGKLSPHTELIFAAGFAQFGATPQPATGHYITVVTGVLSPTSQGSLKLASTDPFAHPLIDPATLTTDFDVNTMVQAMKDAQTFLASPTFAPINPQPYGDLANATTDEAKAAFARANGQTIFHPVGTAKMSPKGASYGVVDPDLLVKGAQGLRIVDASVIPQIPEAHTQAPVYIIAEKAADLIRSTYNLQF